MATKLDWAGKLGKIWADKTDEHDRLLGPIGEAGIAALGDLAGKRVLDIGCGAGATSVAMAKAGATVVGVDISADLLGKAESRDKDNLCTFMLCDAANTDFEQPFDLIYSRFGAMFFDEPVKAWTHLRGQLVAGGKVVVVTWREASENEWVTLPLVAASGVIGEEHTGLSASGIPGPFAWAEETVFTKVFQDAGWAVSAKALNGRLVMNNTESSDPVESAADFAMLVGPLASRLHEFPQDIQRKCYNAVKDALATKLENNEVVLNTAGWVITATA